MRSISVSPPSWVEVGALHGVSLRQYLYTVLLPWLAPVLVIAATVSILLSMADITSVLLLHPPGSPSFPLAIFTVMANAPEPLVATLCLLYVAGGIALVMMSLAAAQILRLE